MEVEDKGLKKGQLHKNEKKDFEKILAAISQVFGSSRNPSNSQMETIIGMEQFEGFKRYIDIYGMKNCKENPKSWKLINKFK